jgi:hypothetical protein
MLALVCTEYKSSFRQHPPDFAATSQKLVATHIIIIAVYEAKSYCIIKKDNNAHQV